MKRLHEKVAVITGGAAGIGKAAVIKFLAEGAKVAVWDVNKQKGTQLVEEYTAKGFQLIFNEVNVSNFESVKKAVEETHEKFGGIDILVNNAGITRDSTLKKMTIEQWQQVIDINLTGVFNCTKAVLDLMLAKGSGKIINTSSVVGLYGNFGQTNYVAAKSGVIGMTKVWARELGRKGINVNAVAPGFIETEMVQAMPENVLATMREKIPLGQTG